MNKVKKLKAKLELLRNPLVKEIIKDMNDLIYCSEASFVSLSDYYKSELKSIGTPCQSHYRQMDLEECIEIEKAHQKKGDPYKDSSDDKIGPEAFENR